MKRLLALLVTLAAGAALLVAPAPANAAATAILYIGPNSVIGHVKAVAPSGTLTYSNGDTTADCTKADTASAPYGTLCSTFTVTCPASATSCVMSVQMTGSAVGSVSVGGFVIIMGGYGAFHVRNSCPALAACTIYATVDGVSPGATAALTAANASGGLLPSIRGQVTMHAIN